MNKHKIYGVLKKTLKKWRGETKTKNEKKTCMKKNKKLNNRKKTVEKKI